MTIKLQIRNRWTGSVLFEYEKEDNTIKETLLAAIRAGSNLRGSDLRDSDLRGSDLRGSDLTPIKDDFFAVLIRSIPEIKYLKQNIIEGKIDGSTYEGECSCLSGTLHRGAVKHNGPKEKIIVKQILDCRNASRPIERFFLGIKRGDTPETNQFSKLALEWLNEFESYITELQPA